MSDIATEKASRAKSSAVNALDGMTAGTYTLPQIAKQCRVHPQTARKWIARGLLPAPIIKVGRVVRWSSTQLEKFLADGVHA